MDLNNSCEEVIPFYESITISPSLIGDQGDVFQCGRCKQTFYSIIEFLSHKKEHASEQRICHMLNGYHAGIIALAQPANEIWVLKDSNIEDIGTKDNRNDNLIVASNTEVSVEDQQHFFKPDFIGENIEEGNTLKCPLNSSLMLITDKEAEESVNSFSCFSCFTCGNNFESDAELTTHTQCHVTSQTIVQEETQIHGEIRHETEKEIRETSSPATICKKSSKVFQCVICGRMFSSKSFLKKHISSHKVWPDGLGKTIPKNLYENERSYLCPYCQQLFETHNKMRTHLKEHKHQKVFKCIQNECAAMFVDLESLISHINITHNFTEYHCHICFIALQSLEEIAMHQQTHSADDEINKNIFKCVHCKAKFRRKDHLKHHLDTASHKNKCDHCDKCFVSEKSLRRHLLQHNKSRSFDCDLCSASFKLKHYLLSHLLTHNKGKQFLCDICSKKFKRKDLLMRHKRLHEPDKRKPCPYRNGLGCMAEFTRTDKLNDHVKMHSKKFLLDTDKSSLEIILLPVQEDVSTH